MALLQVNVELVVYGLFLCGNTFEFFLSVQMIICLTKDLPVRLLLYAIPHRNGCNLLYLHDIPAINFKLACKALDAACISCSSADTKAVGGSYEFFLGTPFSIAPAR